ncbi:MAG: alginate export family protein, partial [Candidatus Omnitrophota bacterium]
MRIGLFALLILFVLPLNSYPVSETTIRVGGDVTSHFIARDLSLQDTGGANSQYEDFVATQVRLRFDAMAGENVSGTLRFINERTFGSPSDDATNTVDLAYVEMKSCFSSNASLIIGRQNLRYGNALIIGDPDTNQTSYLSSTSLGNFGDLSLSKSFDAVRLVLDYTPYLIDFIVSKVYEGTTTVNDDITLFGVNMGYAWNSGYGITEMYFFGSDNAPTVTVKDTNSKTYVLGARTLFPLSEKFILGFEGAYQFGDYRISATSHTRLEACALQMITQYRFLDKMSSKIGLAYTYLSGNDDGTSNYEGWDP